MKKLTYNIAELSDSDKEFFCDMLSYISEHINDIEKQNDKVSIFYDGISKDQLIEKVVVLKQMTGIDKSKENKKVEIELIEDRTSKETINTINVFDEMLSNGQIRQMSEGSYLYAGLYLKIYQYFDRKIEEFARENFEDNNLDEMIVPCLTSIEEYEEGGYFETFPQYIIFSTYMKNNIEIIDRFAKNGIGDGSILNEMTIPNDLLRTATCAPLYPYLKNKIIKENIADCYLMSGKCFRNEGKNVEELSRLKEFYMKEYVFVGSPNSVNDGIEKSYALWDYWMDTFDINCKIETANDSFFASNYKKLRLFQKLGNAKREFKWLIPSTGKYISCSSANFHRTHFTKTYNIKLENSNTYCHTNCFAFGVERLAYAFLSQKGLDINRWDKKTIDEISKYN